MLVGCALLRFAYLLDVAEEGIHDRPVRLCHLWPYRLARVAQGSLSPHLSLNRLLSDFTAIQGPQGPKTLCNACGLRWAKKVRKFEEANEAGGDSSQRPVLDNSVPP